MLRPTDRPTERNSIIFSIYRRRCRSRRRQRVPFRAPSLADDSRSSRVARSCRFNSVSQPVFCALPPQTRRRLCVYVLPTAASAIIDVVVQSVLRSASRIAPVRRLLSAPSDSLYYRVCCRNYPDVVHIVCIHRFAAFQCVLFVVLVQSFASRCRFALSPPPSRRRTERDGHRQQIVRHDNEDDDNNATETAAACYWRAADLLLSQRQRKIATETRVQRRWSAAPKHRHRHHSIAE